jgi:hypothetical protein
MKHRKLKRHHRFKTSIQVRDLKIDLDEVEINLIDTWQKPLLPDEPENYIWDVTYSISTDRKADEGYDELCCYIVAELKMKGEKYHLISLNTLHVYHITKLAYQKRNDILFKKILQESRTHAGSILQQYVADTEYEAFSIPDETEEYWNEMASDQNKYGYIHYEPVETTFKSFTKAELETMRKKATFLVNWIDTYDETHPNEDISLKNKEYFENFSEWQRLHNHLYQYKMIARNNIVFYLLDMLVKIEKGLAEKEPEYLAKEAYDVMAENYKKLMEEWKDDFAKN